MEWSAASPRPLRWLYIDFNSYFASVEQELNPSLRGKPVAVVPVETDATCAIAASYEAKAYGIKTGTPIYEARRMCPGLICVLGQHEKYVHYHHRIRVEVERHIPITAVCSIDEVACRLMDNENSPERSQQIADEIKQGLARNVGVYIRCSIGVAPNRYLAKVATDLQKPDGFTLLLAEALPQRLYSLKLKDLPGIGYNMERRILMAGINSVQQLMQLSAPHMRSIWGSAWGERMWFLLRGLDLPEQATHRSSIGHSHVMAPQLRLPEKARYVARRLVLKAVSRLRRIGYFASVLSFSMRLENGQRLEGSKTCLRAQDSLTFLHMLEQIWNPLIRKSGGLPIKKVSIVLHGLTPWDDSQAELFSSLTPAQELERKRAESMSRALDRINHRFGRDSITLGMLPEQGRSFSGTKIAFTRIPDEEEFLE